MRDWRDSLRPILDGKNAIRLDFDEVSNHVSIGIPEGADSQLVKQLIERNGVPPDAYKIRHVELAIADRQGPPQTLRDTIRPYVEGGYMISPGCTVGFNVYIEGDWFFTTASHCSDALWALDGASFTQPDPGGLIGTEVFDPAAYVTTGCHRYPCRYSDVTLVEYTNASGIIGTIGRPDGFALPDRSLSIRVNLTGTSGGRCRIRSWS